MIMCYQYVGVGGVDVGVGGVGVGGVGGGGGVQFHPTTVCVFPTLKNQIEMNVLLDNS